MLKGILKTIGIVVIALVVLAGLVIGVCTWEIKDAEREYNNGVCNTCEMGQYEFSNATKSNKGNVSYFYECDSCGHIIDLGVQMTNSKEKTMTVDEFVSLPGDFYYIVKAKGDFGVLESDVYMDREVVEVAVCEDTENTICLFIELEENEEPHYRKVF